MQIVKYGHPALRWKSKAIQSINNELRSTIREMFDLMYSAKGIGLAANQVGLPLRFFVVNVTADPLEVDEEIVFLNPRIRRRKGATTGEEGCLSLPGLYANVDRAEEIVVEAFDSTDVPGRVNSLKLLRRCDGDFPFRARLIELLLGEFRGDAAKPFRFLRMLASVVFQEDWIGEEDRHCGFSWGRFSTCQFRAGRLKTCPTLVGGLCQTRGCSTTFP